VRPAGGSGGRGGGGPGGGGPGGGGRGGGGRGGFGADGRGHWNLSLAYTEELDETARIVPGGRVLDLLGGDALSGAGIARRSATLEGGGFYRGFGLRIAGTYAGATHVDGAGVPGSSRLDFGALATLNLRGFIDLGRMPKLVTRAPFFKGTRIALGVTNLFDGVQKVTDANGATPLRYQRGYLNPEGRVFSIELRKQF
jgi:hypothetical protein